MNIKTYDKDEVASQYIFRKMDLLDILQVIKDIENGSMEHDDFRHIATNLSKDLEHYSGGGLPDLMAFEAGILYNMWNHAGISWDTVKSVYVEVADSQPYIEEMFLNSGWGEDPIIQELFDHYNMIKNVKIQTNSK